MTTSDELEQWNLRSLENLLGATKNSNKSLKHLGDTLNHTKVDLSRWGGDAAEAWHDMHGHIRTDIDAQGVQSEALFNRLEKLYPDVRSVQTDYNDLKAGLAKNGFAIAPPGTVVTTPSTPAFDAAPLQWITYMQEMCIRDRLTTIRRRWASEDCSQHAARTIPSFEPTVSDLHVHAHPR